MIVLDLEWNRGYDKTPLEEILQIGAVKLDKLGGTITDTFCIFVHPCVHRKLNHTAKTLPELRAAFDSPYDFPSAVEQFRIWCGNDTVFADWGGDDFAILRQNCDFWKVPAPVATELIDLQMAFSLEVGTNQGLALYRAMEYCQIPTPFTFHNALNDAVYTAVISAWISQDAMALLALPKEIRRLQNIPTFPPQPAQQLGPYSSVSSALNSKTARRLPCPLCGEIAWGRRWYTHEPNRYYADFRCKTHGNFLCRFVLTPTEQEQWEGLLTVPEMTPTLLQDFDLAVRNGAISCKSGPSRKKQFRHFRSRHTSKKPPKTETAR